MQAISIKSRDTCKYFFGLKESLQKTKDENKELKHMLASTRNELKTTKENLGKQKEEFDRLWEHHDDSEQ